MSTTTLVTKRAMASSRTRGIGITLLVIAAAIALFFGFGSDPGEDSALVLEDTTLTLPARTVSLVLATLCAFLGGIQLARGFGRRTYLVLGTAVGIFILSFLIWVAAGKSLNLLGLFKSTLQAAVPITLGALSGVLCERSGVINIGIEGMMLTAAFTGAIVGSASNSLVVGMLAGVAAGALLGAILALLSIRYRADQIIAGTVINIFALGITSYLTALILSNPDYRHLNNPGTFSPIKIPGLSEIPILGSLLFDNNIFIYFTIILVVLIHFGLFRTRWGLRVRAVGEHPKAADTVGIKVLAVRYRNVILGGMVAGLGGAYFTVGSVGNFNEGMTGGRGFIGLAAMIFGRWNPVGAFGAALVFGFADSLQTRLSILGVPVPSEFLLMAPYIATILVVAGVVGRARPPAADGQPYVKE